MKKAFAIGVLAAASLVLVGCQQQPAEPTPVTPNPSPSVTTTLPVETQAPIDITIPTSELPSSTQAVNPVEPTPVTPAEPIKPECTIEDFAKIDLRIAQVIKAEAVEGADKLLRLHLDVGGIQKSVFAAIAKAYKPETLIGRTVIYFANLKPRQMRFGLSEGMILAAGAGGTDTFILSADAGAKPGQKVS